MAFMPPFSRCFANKCWVRTRIYGWVRKHAGAVKEAPISITPMHSLEVLTIIKLAVRRRRLLGVRRWASGHIHSISFFLLYLFLLAH